MRREAHAFLWDAREAARAIQSFVQGIDAAAYASTPLVHSAVERKFEIIGEALNQLAKVDPELAARIPDVPQIVAFRNQLIHGYAVIDHVIVWNTIEHALPSLLTALEGLLGQN